ncbi:MAG: hypothetical protein QOE06_2393 [Thermoleophilaceae bacterium]|jgi:hypothetical protein|nr:hypothetical protein [Thermoleophilaceae bacterium]
MSEPTPYDDFPPSPMREVLRREWLEAQEEERAAEIERAESRARLREAIEYVKQQEALMARRRCWPF